MRLYLDDDTASRLLTRLLRDAGHDVTIPADVGLTGMEDPVHLTDAIRESRSLLTGNHHDFEVLHDLLMQAGGHHPGILVVRRDNDVKRDLTPQGIVRAIANFTAANVPLADAFVILNQWR